MANAGLRVGMVALLGLTLAGVLATPPTDAAQEDADQPPPWVQLSIVQVDPAMTNEFIAVQRELMARARDGDTPWRTVSRTAVFGDNYRFLIATPGEDLAGFNDAGDADAEWTSLMNRLEKYITSRQSYAIRALPDIDTRCRRTRNPA